MSWLTQALTLGLALALISDLGRRKRIVILFDVTQTCATLPGSVQGSCEANLRA